MIIYIAESRIAHFIGAEGHRVKTFDQQFGTRSFILNHLKTQDVSGVSWVPVELRHMDANSKMERLARLAPVQQYLEQAVGIQNISFKWPPFESEAVVPEPLDPAFSRRPEDEYDVEVRGNRQFHESDPQAAFDRMRRSDTIGISPEASLLKQQLKEQREKKFRGHERDDHDEHQIHETSFRRYEDREYHEYGRVYQGGSKMQSEFRPDSRAGLDDQKYHDLLKRQEPSPQNVRRCSRSPEKKRFKEDLDSRGSSKYHRESRRARSRARSRTRSRSPSRSRSRTRSPSPSRKRKSRRARSYSSSRSRSPRRTFTRHSAKHRDEKSRRSRHESASRSRRLPKESTPKKEEVKDYDMQRKEQDDKRKDRFGKLGDHDEAPVQAPVPSLASRIRQSQTGRGKNQDKKQVRQEFRSPKKDTNNAASRAAKGDYNNIHHSTEISSVIVEVPELGKVNQSRLKMMMAEEHNDHSDTIMGDQSDKNRRGKMGNL